MGLRLPPAGNPPFRSSFDPRDCYNTLLELSREGQLKFSLEDVVRQIVDHLSIGAVE